MHVFGLNKGAGALFLGRCLCVIAAAPFGTVSALSYSSPPISAPALYSVAAQNANPKKQNAARQPHFAHKASKSTQRSGPLTLKFDGIDLAFFETSTAASVQRDIHSRVRVAAKRAGLNPGASEIDRAAQKIITLMSSDYVREELANAKKTRVTIFIDLTFAPMTAEAKFQF